MCRTQILQFAGIFRLFCSPKNPLLAMMCSYCSRPHRPDAPSMAPAANPALGEARTATSTNRLRAKLFSYAGIIDIWPTLLLPPPPVLLLLPPPPPPILILLMCLMSMIVPVQSADVLIATVETPSAPASAAQLKDVADTNDSLRERFLTLSYSSEEIGEVVENVIDQDDNEGEIFSGS